MLAKLTLPNGLDDKLKIYDTREDRRRCLGDFFAVNILYIVHPPVESAETVEYNRFDGLILFFSYFYAFILLTFGCSIDCMFCSTLCRKYIGQRVVPFLNLYSRYSFITSHTSQLEGPFYIF